MIHVATPISKASDFDVRPGDLVSVGGRHYYVGENFMVARLDEEQYRDYLIARQVGIEPFCDNYKWMNKRYWGLFK
jgi:hypothetical protein